MPKISWRSKDGKHKPFSSNDIHNLVLHVHPMLANGSEGRIRMENGTTAVFSGIAFFYSLSLRLQEVAQPAQCLKTVAKSPPEWAFRYLTLV